jgi:arsenate reductase
MALKFYGYKKCGTCRKAQKDLEAKGIELDYIDITVQPPSLAELRAIVDHSGKALQKFYNTSGGKYKEMNMKERRLEMSEAEQLELLSQEGYLLKRPLVSDGNKATVGYKAEEFEIWS